LGGNKVSKDSGVDTLVFTGERLIPGDESVDGNVVLEHYHRYALANEYVKDKRVLDIACGEGYGSSLMAANAKSVFGVDVSEEATKFAARKYQSDNLEFLVGSCAAIPLKSNSIDLVISFETIEHHDLHDEMLQEIKRVLTKSGLLIISSPNKYEYSDIPKYLNQYHVKELYRDELVKLLGTHFSNIEMYSQRVLYGSAIVCDDSGGKFVSYNNPKNFEIKKSTVLLHPIYDIAFVSDSKLPAAVNSILEESLAEITAKQTIHIEHLASTLSSVIEHRDALEDALSKMREIYNVDVKARDKHVNDLSTSLDAVIVDRDSNKAALTLEREKCSAEKRKKDPRVHELSTSLESVTVDRDSIKATLKQQQARYNSDMRKRDSLVQELGSSLEIVVVDRDAAKEALIQEQARYNSDMQKRDSLVQELGSSLEIVVVDRDAAKEALSQEQARYNSDMQKRDSLVQELGSSLEIVVVDRDAAKEALSQEQARYNSDMQKRDSLVQELSSSLETVVVDRDVNRAAQKQSSNLLEEERVRYEGDMLLLNEKLVSAKAECNALSAKLKQSNIELEQKAGIYTSVLADTKRQKTEKRSLQDHHDELQNELLFLKCQLVDVYKSKTWRYTSFLRRLIGFFMRSSPSGESTLDFYNKSSYKMATSNSGAETEQAQKCSKKAGGLRGILLVSFYCPTRAHAGGLRILDIYSLIRKNCPSVELDLFTHCRPDIDWSIDELDDIFHNVYLSPNEDLTPEGLANISGSNRYYEVIDLQFHQCGYHIDDFRKIGGKIIFTPMESASKSFYLDIRSSLKKADGFSLADTWTSLHVAAEEIGFLPKVDEVVCVSEADAAHLKSVSPRSQISSLETGVSQFEFGEAFLSSFKNTPAINRQCSILYVAYFGSETNIRALHWYLENVHRKVESTVDKYCLRVVGRGDLSSFSDYFDDDSIDFVGEVPTLAPYISSTRVGIAPAIGGSGFRGKVNQYSALGVPSVVSSIAHNGLSYTNGVDVFIADSADDFSESCIKLLTDLELNDRMGALARELCLTRYTWQAKWPTLRTIYQLE
jgi:SAM-dependent methyltransferase/glycosyltransferase involved in cell wall biosynthesis